MSVLRISRWSCATSNPWRVDYVIPKSADLLGPIDLIVDLNAAEVPTGNAASNIGNYSAWVESLGYAMIEEMSFMVGSHTVEKITGDQMNIINELMKGDTQRQHKLVGKTGRSAITLDVDETGTPVAAVAASGTGNSAVAAVVASWPLNTYSLNDSSKERLICAGNVPEKGKQLIIPLSFFFTKHPSQYFPLCAIAGCNDVRVSIKFRALNELLIIGRHNYVTSTAGGSSGVGDAAVLNVAVPIQSGATTHPLPKFTKAIEAAQLRCHYVHVTGPEATTLMNKEHVRLMKLWHHQPTTFLVNHTMSATGAGNEKSFNIDLGFLHPVQELIITIRKRGNMTSSTEPGGVPDFVDQGATTKNFFAYEGGGTDPNIESHLQKIKAHGTHQATSDTTSNYLQVRNFKLSLNGQERHPSLAGTGIERGYLMDRLMPMLHSNTSETFTSASVTDAGHDASATFAHLGEMLDRKEIYVYPFALNPEGANPSGAVNFSKVSHAKLTIDYTAFLGAATADEEYVVDVYGVYFNWLQIKDGRALTSFQ